MYKKVSNYYRPYKYSYYKQTPLPDFLLTLADHRRKDKKSMKVLFYHLQQTGKKTKQSCYTGLVSFYTK